MKSRPIDLCEKGTKVFLKNPRKSDDAPSWVVGVVVDKNGDDVSCEIAAGAQKLRQMKKPHEILICENPECTDYMSIHFEHPSNPGIIEALRTRFGLKGLSYTSAGSTLVSVNPMKVSTIEKTNATIYDLRAMHKCRARISQLKLLGMTRSRQATERPEPHPYILADQAYESLHSTRQPQTIVMSGITGTGKSENAKLIINYLVNIKSLHSHPVGIQKMDRRGGPRGTTPSGPLGMIHNPFILNAGTKPLDRIMLAAFSALEAFSCAKTATNDNSSRAGKFIKMFFGGTPEFSGAEIKTFALEKSRVVRQDSPERSFHIFYQLINGADDALKVRLSKAAFF